MKRVSKQRSRDNARYRKMRLKFLMANTVCFRCGDVVPFEKRQVHHFYGKIHALLCYEPGFRMADPECHFWIESHRKESIQLGFRASERLWNRPGLIIGKQPNELHTSS